MRTLKYPKNINIFEDLLFTVKMLIRGASETSKQYQYKIWRKHESGPAEDVDGAEPRKPGKILV